jgi:hypothetical protein
MARGGRVEQQSPFVNSSEGRRTLGRLGAAVARGAGVTLRSGPARAGLALLLLPGVAWFVALTISAASIALGLRPGHGFANALAAVLLTPVLAACVVPLLDASLALLLGRDGPERWSRIMAEAGAALTFACFATVISAALWPGVAFLALATALGCIAGVLRWQPSERPTDDATRVPLLLLLLEEPSGIAARRLVAPVSSESKAA